MRIASEHLSACARCTCCEYLAYLQYRSVLGDERVPGPATEIRAGGNDS